MWGSGSSEHPWFRMYKTKKSTLLGLGWVSGMHCGWYVDVRLQSKTSSLMFVAYRILEKPKIPIVVTIFGFAGGAALPVKKNSCAW